MCSLAPGTQARPSGGTWPPRVEAGRPLEIDPLVGTVLELADRLDIPAPALRHVSALLKLQAETLGLYARP